MGSLEDNWPVHKSKGFLRFVAKYGLIWVLAMLITEVVRLYYTFGKIDINRIDFVGPLVSGFIVFLILWLYYDKAYKESSKD